MFREKRHIQLAVTYLFSIILNQRLKFPSNKFHQCYDRLTRLMQHKEHHGKVIPRSNSQFPQFNKTDIPVKIQEINRQVIGLLNLVNIRYITA